MPEQSNAFKGIVLAFSGGGYRAAAFHLGTLKMLDKLGLLKSVRGLSTISGGTIVGAAYVKSLVEGKPFGEFLDGFRSFMTSTNVVKMALAKIRETREANGKRVAPSLIRSAANVYAEEYFGDMRFRKILDKRAALAEKGEDFPEISFNATEFRVGNAFRFQSSRSGGVGSGNNDLDIPQYSNTNKAVRVADIVAASSCFPSGFEPIRFPSDFVWESDFDLARVKEELNEKGGDDPDEDDSEAVKLGFRKEVPLMDGGVFDNQGVDSGRNIIKRSDMNPLIDLLVISDTDPGAVLPDTDPPTEGLLMSPVAEDKGRFHITVNLVYILLLLIVIFAFVSSVAIVVNLVGQYREPTQSLLELIFLNAVPLVFSVTAFLAILIARFFIKKELRKVRTKMEIPVWAAVRHLRVSEIVELVFSRLESLIVMANSVFMKRIRGLQQGLVTRGKSTREVALFNHIYGLRLNSNRNLIPSKNVFDKNDWGRFIKYEELRLSDRIRKVSDTATRYPTNLWFKDDDATNLDNLIECGEASFCYFLLVYLLRRRSDQLEVPGSPERRLFDSAKSEWAKVNS